MNLKQRIMTYKKGIKIYLQYNNETNRWDISIPSDNKPTRFSNAYTTFVVGKQAKILIEAIDGDGILAASCKHYDQKTNGLIGLETY